MAFNNVPLNGWPQIKGLDDVSVIPGMIEDISRLVKEVTDLKRFTYTPGAIDLDNVLLYGHLTQGATELYLSLPILINGDYNTYSIASMPNENGTVTARGVGGYLKDSQGVDMTASYSVAGLKLESVLHTNKPYGSITLILKNIDNGAFSGTDNNTVVDVWFSKCRMSLTQVPTRDGDTEPVKDPDVKSAEETETTKRSTKKTNGGK